MRQGPHARSRTSTGEVWGWGKGEYGRLGNGGSSDQMLPEPVELLCDMGPCKAIASGASFCLAVTNEGHLYAWGRNEQGQLGIGGSMSMDVYSMEDYPLRVRGVFMEDDIKVHSIAAGVGQALATTHGGSRLFQWGMGQWLEPREFPFEEGGPELLVDMACGTNFNAVVDNKGGLYTWGKGFLQKKFLGHEHQSTEKFPAKLDSISNVTQVSAGGKHTIALMSTE